MHHSGVVLRMNINNKQYYIDFANKNSLPSHGDLSWPWKKLRQEQLFGRSCTGPCRSTFDDVNEGTQDNNGAEFAPYVYSSSSSIS